MVRFDAAGLHDDQRAERHGGVEDDAGDGVGRTLRHAQARQDPLDQDAAHRTGHEHQQAQGHGEPEQARGGEVRVPDGQQRRRQPGPPASGCR
ncbi:MAG: hypothetical protein AB7I25_10110, partial [Vicinamibacterales bacterium]